METDLAIEMQYEFLAENRMKLEYAEVEICELCKAKMDLCAAIRNPTLYRRAVMEHKAGCMNTIQNGRAISKL